MVSIFIVSPPSVGWKGGSIVALVIKRLMLLLLFASSLAWAQGLEIVTLRHRQAEALLPQLLPFVEPGGALNGMGDKLFLRASARNQAELRQLIAALDTPQRRLMISLRQEGSDTGSAGGAGASARVEVGAGGTAISGRGHLYQSDSQGRRNVAQQVQTIDGGRAAIMVGQSYFLPMRQLVIGPGGAILSETLVQRDLGTGFVAVPRLAGDRVTVEISPRDDTPGPLPGSVNSQRLVTTVSGRLGDWIELGGSGTEQSASGSGIIRYSTQSASRQRRLLLRIEALD
jgi:hypothetical protein